VVACHHGGARAAAWPRRRPPRPRNHGRTRVLAHRTAAQATPVGASAAEVALLERYSDQLAVMVQHKLDSPCRES